MNKITSLLVVLLATTALWAYDFQSGDLCYNITSDTTVEVTYTDKSFENYKNITTVNIPAAVDYKGKTYKVTRLGDFVFYLCKTIASVTIPDGVTSIEQHAFFLCDKLTSVSIPSSVESIGESAFGSCRGLSSITIPEGVKRMEEGAFNDCEQLTSIVIPSTVNKINNFQLFSDCNNLTSIVVDKNNPTFDSRDNCNAIIETATNTLVVGCNTSFIPNTIVKIDSWAFDDCEKMTSIFIPKSVRYIDDRSFVGCKDVVSIVVEEGNPVYDSHNNCNAIIETASAKLFLGCQNTIIPNGITTIGEAAFYSCSNLTSIVIPDDVTVIDRSAFAYCSNLTTVTMSKNVTTIKWDAFNCCRSLTAITLPSTLTKLGGAFWGCMSLTSIVIPNEVKEIDSYTFYDCSGLTSVTIGSNVETIGNNAFASCTNLKTVTVLADIPPVCDASFDTERLSQMTLLVAPEVLTAYQIADTWKDFGNIAAIGTTDVEDITGNTPNAQKVIIRNGQVLIQQGDALYNLAGVSVENN